MSLACFPLALYSAFLPDTVLLSCQWRKASVFRHTKNNFHFVFKLALPDSFKGMYLFLEYDSCTKPYLFLLLWNKPALLGSTEGFYDLQSFTLATLMPITDFSFKFYCLLIPEVLWMHMACVSRFWEGSGQEALGSPRSLLPDQSKQCFKSRIWSTHPHPQLCAGTAWKSLAASGLSSMLYLKSRAHKNWLYL